MQIAPDLLQQIVEHALREAPDECCGYVVLDGDRAVEVVELENQAHSPYRFDIASQDVYRLGLAADTGVVIYHSHTRSDPVPSQTDLTFAANWPGVDWLIVGVKGEQPDVRNWRIEGGKATQVEVRVDAAPV
jgi:proteasome lid subunit RPN8/RPN11